MRAKARNASLFEIPVSVISKNPTAPPGALRVGAEVGFSIAVR